MANLDQVVGQGDGIMPRPKGVAVMVQDVDVRRQELLGQIRTHQASIDKYVRISQRRRDLVVNISIVSSAIAAALMVGPTVGGATFAETVQRGLGFEESSSAWRLLCLASLIVNLVAAISSNLNNSNDSTERINIAQACNAELEALRAKVEIGNVPASTAVGEYRQIVAKVLFVPRNLADNVDSEDEESTPSPPPYHSAEVALPGMAIVFGCTIVVITVIGLLLGQGKGAAADNPRLMLSSSQIQVGDTYSISALGFSPKEDVQFSWIGPTNGTMGPFRADNGGSTTLAGILVTPPGVYTVTARGLTSGHIVSTQLVVQPGN